MRALIAEDDLHTRNALRTILEQEGWVVSAWESGTEALNAFRAGQFDLVCLDVMMPGHSGYDVCRIIRKKDAQVPVLFMSAKSEEIDKVLGLELGADDFIVKPFGVREVQARIRAVLRRSNATARSDGRSAEDAPTKISGTEDFAFGPWQVLPGELRARRNGGPAADLSRREVQLLRLLAENPGRVIHREEFFRVCWGLEAAPLSRTLDQHIARLRKKIEEDPANPILIQTVQGAGYRYEEDSHV